MSDFCVIIEGQLRGSRQCGPRIHRHLVEALDADLVICAQYTPEYDTQRCAQRYGEAVRYLAYNNPTRDFSDIFDTLCTEYGFTFDWRETFRRVKSYNYHLGFDQPGTCIRRMYNRHRVYKLLQGCEYQWYILARSDLYFLADFPIDQCRDPGKLYSAAVGQWRGINNNLLMFGSPLRRAVLNYITLFLDGSIARLGNSPTPWGMNEEEFFKRAMDLQSVPQQTLHHNWFISADSTDELCTWGAASIHQHASGLLYKYQEEFDSALCHAGVTL